MINLPISESYLSDTIIFIFMYFQLSIFSVLECSQALENHYRELLLNHVWFLDLISVNFDNYQSDFRLCVYSNMLGDVKIIEQIIYRIKSPKVSIDFVIVKM